MNGRGGGSRGADEALERAPLANRGIGAIMTRAPVAVSVDTDLETAAKRMLDRRIGSLLVVDAEGRLVGILTESDFAAREARIPFSTFKLPQVLGRWMGKEGVERIYHEARSRRVEEIMSAPVYTVDETGTLAEVLELMLRRDVVHVPIVRDRRPVGIVARHDLLKLMRDEIDG